MSAVYDTLNEDRSFVLRSSVQDPAMKKKGYGIYALLLGSLACVVLYSGRQFAHFRTNSTEVSLVARDDNADLDGKQIDYMEYLWMFDNHSDPTWMSRMVKNRMIRSVQDEGSCKEFLAKYPVTNPNGSSFNLINAKLPEPDWFDYTIEGGAAISDGKKIYLRAKISRIGYGLLWDDCVEFDHSANGKYDILKLPDRGSGMETVYFRWYTCDRYRTCMRVCYYNFEYRPHCSEISKPFPVPTNPRVITYDDDDDYDDDYV